VAFAGWRQADLPPIAPPTPASLSAAPVQGKLAEPGPAWPAPPPRLIIF
jgi:hypothetical protein